MIVVKFFTSILHLAVGDSRTIPSNRTEANFLRFHAGNMCALSSCTCRLVASSFFDQVEDVILDQMGSTTQRDQKTHSEDYLSPRSSFAFLRL